MSRHAMREIVETATGKVLSYKIPEFDITNTEHHMNFVRVSIRTMAALYEKEILANKPLPYLEVLAGFKVLEAKYKEGLYEDDIVTISNGITDVFEWVMDNPQEFKEVGVTDSIVSTFIGNVVQLLISIGESPINLDDNVESLVYEAEQL